MKNDTTLIIQGPLNQVSLETLGIYKQYFSKIIISHWDTDNTILLHKKKYYYNTDIEYLENKLPSVNSIYNINNLYLQTLSCLNALNICETENVVKIRSDEYYTKLNFIIDKIEQHKYTCSNIFFRRYKDCPLHVSDHIIAGKKEELALCFTNVKKLCEQLGRHYTNIIPLSNILDGMPGHLFAEVVIFLNFLTMFYNFSTIRMQAKQLMLKHIQLVSIYDLGDILISANCYKRKFTDAGRFFHFEKHSIQDIREL